VRLSAAIVVSLVGLSGVARADLVQAQTDLAQAQVQTARLSTQRVAVQSELDRLGEAIAGKKRALPVGSEPGAELTEMLRESARLASQLDELQRDVAAATMRSQQAAEDLARSCDVAVSSLQSRWAESPPSERPGLENRIAEVNKSCTGRSLGQLDKPAGSSIPASALSPTATDDAQTLRQKADFLHDREDLLRKRIAQMNQRIDALNRERTLARHVSEFVKEQDLFDEDDTRVSASRTEYGVAAAPQTPASGAQSISVSQNNKDGSAPGANSGGAAGGGGGDNPVGANPGANGGGGGFNNGAAPILGSVASPADAPSGTEGPQGSRQTYTGTRPEELRVGDDVGDDDSLEGLRAQRAALEQEAKKLHEAATTLEHGADKPQ
jgi:hypothetical protein